MSQIRRILFIELLGGLGDVLIALPAIQALSKTYPQATLTVLTFAPGHELLHHNPLIDQVVRVPKGEGEARRAVERLLAEQRFDLIVSDTTYEGIAEAIQQSGAAHMVTNLWRSPPDNERVSDRFLKILQQDGYLTPAAIPSDQPLLHLLPTEQLQARSALGAAYRPLVVLYPDAGMAIKLWSISNFITLGQALQQQHGATLIVPVGADFNQAEAIATGIGGMARLWQRGTLRQLAALMAEAELVIAADTGPARIAAALNVPTITLFGPSWHERYGQPAPHINLQGYPQCPERKISNFTEQSCWYSGTCPLDWHTCLEDISPARVLEAAEMLLEKGRSPKPEHPQAKHPQDITFTDFSPHSKLKTQNSKHPSPHPNKGQPQKITPTSLPPIRNLLVMRLDNIGDVIMTSPTLRALRENLPDAHMTLMASPGGALTVPLLPWVNEVLPWRTLWQDLGKLSFDPEREWALIETLRDRQFDAAIILTSFSQSPHPPGLVCALAGIPIRVGESKEAGMGTLTHPISPAPDEIHQVERNLRLIESVGFQVRDRRLCLQIPAAAPQAIAQLLATHAPTASTAPTANPNYLLLNPWTSCQSRTYDLQRFATAARHLSDRTGYPVVVTGMEKDRDRAHTLFNILGDRAIDLIGKTTLAELTALIAQARLVLTNNTSTMHIADATQTPSVVLFAGTERECQWQPRHSSTQLLRRPTVCSPCYAFTCPHSLECLDIEPEAVVRAGVRVLEGRVSFD